MRRMRVGIVGSGISGLAAAWLLRSTCDVAVLEADDRVGGHTHTVDVSLDGTTYAIDTGFIVFNESGYPCFSRLLRALNVPSHETNMSFSVRCDQSGLEYNGTSLNGLFAQRSNLFRVRIWAMVRDMLRFHRIAAESADRIDDSVTVEQFLKAHRLGRTFAEQYLIPMGAALWSCPPGLFRTFPIRFVIDFFRHHRMLQVSGRPVWRVVTGGSRTYVDRLTSDLPHPVRTGMKVARVSRTIDGPRVTMESGETIAFDHVILACHADQSLALLDAPDSNERRVLSAFPYQANEAVLHTDERMLPRARRAWASWNYHRISGEDQRSTVTYNMNMLQGIDAPATFLVTLNETSSIDPQRVLGRYMYHHPQYTRDRQYAQQQRAAFLNRGGISFCGAYWGYGFHEDGARSGAEAAAALGGDPEKLW